MHRSLGTVLRSNAKDMTITFVIINTQSGNGLECGWRHPRKKWSWEFEDFEKESVATGPFSESWVFRRRKLDFDHWKCVGFFGSLPTEILDITRCTARWDAVSIIRIVSLSSCRHEPKSGINYLKRQMLYTHLLIHAEIYIYILDKYWHNDKRRIKEDTGRLL